MTVACETPTGKLAALNNQPSRFDSVAVFCFRIATTLWNRLRARASRSPCQLHRKRESARLWTRIRIADAPRTIWQKYETTGNRRNVGRTSAAPVRESRKLLEQREAQLKHQ